jgi:hypothetical protein
MTRNPPFQVMLSSLPWHETFYKLLNHAAELTHSSDAGELARFLQSCYDTRVPLGGTPFRVAWAPSQPEEEEEGGGGEASEGTKTREFTCQTPLEHSLPSLPENVRGLIGLRRYVAFRSMVASLATQDNQVYGLTILKLREKIAYERFFQAFCKLFCAQDPWFTESNIIFSAI